MLVIFVLLKTGREIKIMNLSARNKLTGKVVALKYI